MTRNRSDLDDREMRAWQTFFRMTEVLRGRIEQQLQAGNGLSIADYSVLTILSGASDGRLRAYELGNLLEWEKSRLHHQLTRMSRRGLVERRACGSRAIQIEITEAGRRALTEAAPGHSDHVRELVIDRLTPQQLDQLAEISAVLLADAQEPASVEP